MCNSEERKATTEQVQQTTRRCTRELRVPPAATVGRSRRRMDSLGLLCYATSFSPVSANFGHALFRCFERPLRN
ncbi:hypothetical protein M407DRAFT_241228 [Tulasnella calospora MUT 4182]|uniref:Uncharacterized protein n=1 Tax=Tulasnella calospora MUT 4182 TaxID=1051891 RepID=A0A0C3QW33_9AGAM|nr:hypothetical protein M407DRAFT_241228 [Tulasnella calospora MUT 4182]